MGGRGFPLRRWVVSLTPAPGESSDLSGALSWSEARATVRRLRLIFSDPEARAKGWTLVPLPRGFVASRRGGLELSFSISEVPGAELTGHARRREAPTPDHAAADNR